MSRWGYHFQDQQEGIDFVQIFKANPTAYQLLQVPNIADEVKAKNKKITQLLIQSQNNQILEDLIRIALNPSSFIEQTQKTLDNKMTHTAVEILTNLSEEFVENIFDNPYAQEDEVIQSEKEYPTLNFIFKIITEPGVTETCLAYFSKLVTPFIYQRPGEMLNFFTHQGLDTLIELFWSPSVAEVISKILQAENEDVFFEKEKLLFFQTLFSEISKLKQEQKIQQIIENVGQLFDSLVQKHQDKYEKAKYSNMIKSLLKEVKKFSFLINDMQLFCTNNKIRSQILHCLEALLRIHEPQKPGSKVHEESSGQQIQLNPEFKEKVKIFFIKHNPLEFVTDSNILLLNYYKVLKKLLTLDPQLSEELLSKQILVQTLSIMKEYPNNNILHNFQKDVLLLGINNSNNVCSLLQNQIELADSLRSSISEGNSKVSYQHQLFLIGEAVKTKSQQNNFFAPSWSDLEEPLKNKRAFYSVVIGPKAGDNKDKWGNFQDDLILKPLQQNNEKDHSESKSKKQHQKNGVNQFLTRLNQLSGTEVLSEEQQDDFPTQQNSSDNPHYIDDVGLPLDSDKSEDQINNALVNKSSEEHTITPKEQPNHNSEKERQTQKNGGILQIPTITAHKTQSIVAIDFGECFDDQENPVSKEKPQQFLFSKNSTKQEINLLDSETMKLTKSINIEDEELVEKKSMSQQREVQICHLLKQYQQDGVESVPSRQQIQTLLYNKYTLELKESIPCHDELHYLLTTKYKISFC